MVKSILQFGEVHETRKTIYAMEYDLGLRPERPLFFKLPYPSLD